MLLVHNVTAKPGRQNIMAERDATNSHLRKEIDIQAVPPIRILTDYRLPLLLPSI
jgi:hypothetical protein